MRDFPQHDVSNESVALLAELHARTRHVQEACRQGGRVKGSLLGLFTDDASRVAYCFLPKVGCTFWIRVFSFLHNYTGDTGKVASPWDIPRLKVHGTPQAHGFSWSSVQNKAKDYLRFMFVRDPYSRLWSAYLDKLFLPDFWRELGVPTVAKIRGANATAHARRCGNDVTFDEFVRYSLISSEPHYNPIFQRCDPCQFRPTVIGSLDTFARDSQFLLRRMGMEWVLKDIDRNQQEEKELTTLVDYNYERVNELSFYKNCVTYRQLSEILWRAFQFNGYLPNDASYSAPANFSISEFKEKVVKAFVQAKPRKAELKQQKKDFMKKAYAGLPKSLLERIEYKYAPDIRYFNFPKFDANG